MRIRKWEWPGTIEENLPAIKAVIARSLENGTADIAVRKTAEAIIRAAKVPARDYLGEIRAVHRWVKGHLRYTNDPLEVELIKTPKRMLMDYARDKVMLADCDESALLTASLLRSIGHNAGVVLMDTSPFSPEITHAITKVEYPRRSSRWVFLETVKDKELGWTPSHTREIYIG